MLFELETLFSWSSSHIEINSILISGGKNGLFSIGADEDELSKISADKLRKFNSRLRKIINVVEELKPDVLVSTGDLVDGQINKLDENGIQELDIHLYH